MGANASKLKWAVVIVLALVLLIDQSSKFWVKLNMAYGEEFLLFGLNWARIHFVENEGMAFGISLGGKIGKLLLSLFRIGAVIFLIYIIRQMIENRQPLGLIISLSLILAGAIGNILDSAFYGIIFSQSTYHGQVAELFPEQGGYAPFLFGKVVDMLYFPLVDTVLPEWVPFRGGQRFEFFKPVFNVADSSITTGITIILLFYRGIFSANNEPKNRIDDVVSEPGQLETK